ncbi:MAG: hypothetical protein M5U15_15100 [Kiritimatiellae bacterium]|nr:hypothetical protein [Kiritimatiellia bacterium]
MSETIKRVAVGIDFGGTSVKLALVDDRGQILARRRFMTHEASSQSAWVERVRVEVQDILGKEGRDIRLPAQVSVCRALWILIAALYTTS